MTAEKYMYIKTCTGHCRYNFLIQEQFLKSLQLLVHRLQVKFASPKKGLSQLLLVSVKDKKFCEAISVKDRKKIAGLFLTKI